MSKALIVGAAGFVGPYLAESARNAGMQVVATRLPTETLCIPGAEILELDILHKQAVVALLEKTQPDVIFHLAAQSSVALSWKRPDITVDVNIKGTLNLMDAVRESELTPRTLLIGSGEEYGPVQPQDVPILETVVPNPQNIYAITKQTQNQLGALYAKAYGMDILCTRSFNHIGPGQQPGFVVADFCKQVAEIEKGAEPVMRVGNLSARRDFTDVRDVVAAYLLLAQKGQPGQTYNIGSGKAVAIQEILDSLLRLSSKEIAVEVDPTKFRPVDVPLVEADITKLQKATGWKPQIPLQETLLETLEYWRGKV